MVYEEIQENLEIHINSPRFTVTDMCQFSPTIPEFPHGHYRFSTGPVLLPSTISLQVLTATSPQVQHYSPVDHEDHSADDDRGEGSRRDVPEIGRQRAQRHHHKQTW